MKRQLLLSLSLSLLCAGWGSVAFATDLTTGSTITAANGATYTTTSTNLITNGSFESGFDGWTNSSDFSTTIVSNNFSLENSDAHDGEQYLKGTANNGATGTGSLGKAWEIGAGKNYVFIYWIKGENENATDASYMKTSMTNTAGKEWKILEESSKNITTEWKEIVIPFTNGAEGEINNYQYLMINFRWLDSQWGFDDFQLYEVNEATADVSDDEYEEGDMVYYDGTTYKIMSENLFVNGGFTEGVTGWTAGGYTTAADISNFTGHANGGYNNGRYLTTNGEGVSSAKTISQSIAVSNGSSYLFIGYTSGKTPNSTNAPNYNCLFNMSNSTTENSILTALNWGADYEDEAYTWTKTMFEFNATTSYVGMRMGWNSSTKFDGFQLYKVEAIDSDLTDVSPSSPIDMTSLIANPEASQSSSTGWTCSEKITRAGGQHWSGDGNNQYIEPNHWSDSGIFEESIYQTITLPYNGVYRLTAAGRSSSNARTILFAGDMEYIFPAMSDVGGTIATDGTTCEVGTAGKEFAHDGAGYGWNWGSVEIVASAGSLKIGARFEEVLVENHKWASVDDFKLEFLGNGLEAVKDALSTDITDAKAIDVTTNVGTEAFMRPQTAADALTAAIETAEAALEASDASVESITAAITALQAAVQTFEAVSLNEPSTGQTFSIILKDELTKDNVSYYDKAVYFHDTGSSHSDAEYRYHFNEDWNRNYAVQQFTFTPDESMTDGYIISFVDDDNTTRYLQLSDSNGQSGLGIRATSIKDNAYVFQVMATIKEDVWYIYNNAEDKPVGAGNADNGLYTGNQYSSLQLVSNEIPVNITEAGWTTLVLPYDAELPSTDLKAYTIAGQSTSQDNAVTLTEVTGELQAKTPYLISGTEEKEYAINGTSTIFDLSTEVKDDYLVGTWEYISSVTAGNYVLQYQPEASGTAFYIVDETQGHISLAANRCYLLGTSVSTANAPYFSLSMGDDMATAIESALEAVQSEGNEAIYDLSGRKVSKAQKGIYIKGGKKVIIK